jgi:hypothetical protein
MTRRERLVLGRNHHSQDTNEKTNGDRWETEVIPEPMITTSLRLPQRLMADVRTEAGRRGIKPSALIRTILEGELAGSLPEQPDLELRVGALEDAVRRLSR